MSVPRGKRNKWSTEFRLTEAGAVVDRNQSGNWEGDEESSAGRQWKENLLAEACQRVETGEADKGRVGWSPSDPSPGHPFPDPPDTVAPESVGESGPPVRRCGRVTKCHTATRRGLAPRTNVPQTEEQGDRVGSPANRRPARGARPRRSSGGPPLKNTKPGVFVPRWDRGVYTSSASEPRGLTVVSRVADGTDQLSRSRVR